MTHSHAMQQRARMLAGIDGREPCYFCTVPLEAIG